jgi:peptide deformylase
MPKILKIVTNPNPLLRKISRNVDAKTIASQEFKNFCASLVTTMVKKDGVGLAAPQTGKNIRVFTVDTKDGPIIFINPKILKKSWAKEWSEEGCLSVPQVFGKVKRSNKIVCEYIDRNGAKKKIMANGLLAFVMQHENDHLDGILFIDKAKEIEKMTELHGDGR